MSALVEQVGRLHAIAAELGREPSSIEITAMWSFKREKDLLGAYRELGVSRLVVPLSTLGAPPSEGLEALAEVVAAG